MTGSLDSKSARSRLRRGVHRTLAAEFASVRDGKPATFPMTPFYDEERDRLVVSTAPAFAGKVENVRADPKVSLLFSDADGSLLVTGEASIRDDDLEANAEYVRRLIEGEPDTPKRAAMTKSVSFLGTRLGRWLLGWYGLRIVIEIEPTSIERVAGDAALRSFSAWDAAGIDRTEAEAYDRAVFTSVGADGYPRSWPATDLSVRDGALVVDWPEGESAVDGFERESTVEGSGRAPVADGEYGCLLFHWHADDLNDLGQRLVRGRYRVGDDGATFVAGSSSALRNDTALDFLRFVYDGKRRTRAYFAERGRSRRT